MRKGFRLGSVSGIELRIDWSLAIIFVLIVSMLGGGLFPAWHPEWSAAHSWATAFASALLFFASVLVHELSHALTGRAHGIPVKRITLFVFGGMAQLEREPHEWRAELWMAIVGPLTSLVLGIAFLVGAESLMGDVQVDPTQPAALLAQLGTAPTLLLWLGQVNIVLALFNLVPAFPLDGGRVLRAALWGATGDLLKATRWASSLGQAFAWLLIAAGLAMILGLRVPLFGTGLVGGLWLAFIGWLLNSATLMGYRQLVLQEAFQDLAVGDLMQKDFVAVSPDLSVAALVEEHLMRSSQRTFPVMDGQRLAGLVSFEDVRKLDRGEWPHTSVRDVMTPIGKLATVAPQDDAFEVLRTLGSREINQLPVVEGRTLRGLLRREDLLKWLALYGEANRPTQSRTRHSW